MIEKVTNLIETFKNMKAKEIEAYKYIIFFLIIADMFGVFYYLKLKSLGIALLLILMGFLTIFLLLERNLKGGENKMEENEEPKEDDTFLDLTKPKKEKKEKVEDDFAFSDTEFKMPTSESCKEALKNL